MTEQMQGEFLRKRMIELREKNGFSQSDMAAKLYVNKATLSRAEGGSSNYKTIHEYAEKYWEIIFDPDKLLRATISREDTDRRREQARLRKQKELFLRGDKVIVTDTSALLKRQLLIEELSKEYSKVIVPSIVVDELTNIKNKNINGLATKAWQIIRSINSQNNAVTMDYTGDNSDDENDSKIIDIARKASEMYNCSVDIITYDADFAARLSGDDAVRALFLEEYIITKQNIIDINGLKKIDEYYADSYDDIEKVLKINIPSEEDINAYLPNGNTLIISVVRNRRPDIEQRKEKIRWLIRYGADVDKRDCAKYYFPAISHSIQNGDFEMFQFLLHECKANPNIGSRNPQDAGKIRQKNDGNMPLMIAAWDNKINYVKELCADERTSLNQQDGNGFTALIKACYWGWLECRDILIEAGADQKIVDRDGYTAEDRYNEYLETGRRKNANFKKKPNGGFRK